MLKSLVENLSEVPEAFRSEYKEREDGTGYEIQLEGLDALKRAKDHEKDARKVAEGANRALQDQVSDLKLKLSDKDHDLTKAKAASCEHVRKVEVDRICQQLAGERGFLLKDHVAKRVSGELVDGEVRLSVLDVQGEPSELTLEQLETEFRENESFSPIIIATKAKGGGATPSSGSQSHHSDPSKMTSEERLQLKQRDPQRFKELFGLR